MASGQDHQTGREEQWRLFSLATSNMLWNWNFADDSVERSVAFETTFGYARTEIDEHINWWVERLHDEDRPRVLAVFDQAKHGGESRCQYEYRFRRRDGTYADISDSVFIMRDSDGTPVRALGAMTDISDRKALEQERDRSARLASVGLLAAGVAHDYNNLLMGVDLNASLLEEMVGDNPDARSALQEISGACEAMAALSRRMLTFSRGPAPRRQAVDIGRLVEEHSRLATSGSRVDLDLQVPSEATLCMLDTSQIGQAVSHVVLNAVQALPEGGRIGVTATIEDPFPGDETGARQWIRIEIADDGPGISPDVLPHVFDLYFSAREGGTGLGLALTQSIVARHRGTVSVESPPGAGATFTLRLPLVAAPSPQG